MIWPVLGSFVGSGRSRVELTGLPMSEYPVAEPVPLRCEHAELRLNVPAGRHHCGMSYTACVVGPCATSPVEVCGGPVLLLHLAYM